MKTIQQATHGDSYDDYMEFYLMIMILPECPVYCAFSLDGLLDQYLNRVRQTAFIFSNEKMYFKDKLERVCWKRSY